MKVIETGERLSYQRRPMQVLYTCSSLLRAVHCAKPLRIGYSLGK